MIGKIYIYDVLWAVVLLTTITLWFFLYKSWTTEYDENIAFLIFAILISILTSIILYYLIVKDKVKHKTKAIIKFISMILGTPISLIFIWTYFQFFHMKYISTEYSTMPKNNYELEKFRNSFKSRNTLIDEDFAVKSDTIVSVITNNGDIEELYRIVKNGTIKLKIGEIRYLTKEKMRGLTS